MSIPATVLLSIEGKNGLLSGRLSPSVYDMVREMPGRRKWRERELIFELTAQNIEHICNNLHNYNMSTEFKKRWEEIQNLRQREAELSQARSQEIDITETRQYQFATPPFEHQFKAFKLSRDIPYFGYFMEMGTGKTKVCIDKFCYSYSIGRIETVVILAPNGVHRQWIKEQIPLHIWREIPFVSSYYSAGNQEQINACKNLFNHKDHLKIISINIETLSYASGKEFLEYVMTVGGKVFMAVDESSRIKNISAQRTKTVVKLGHQAVEKVILSGTPVTQGVEDLYAQFMFLNPDILGFSSYYTFRNRYCQMKTMKFSGRSFEKVVGYKNIEELTRKIDGNSFRVLKEECLDLPEKIFANRYVEMTPEQSKHYLLLKKVFLTQLDSGEIVDGAMAVTRLIRFQQLLSGHLPKGDGTFEKIPTNRLNSLLECIEECSHKLIVWARFVADIKLIQMALNDADIGCVTYFGETSADDRSKALEEFKNNPDCKVLIGNPSAAGIGLNLTVAKTAIWYSMSFSLEEYLQANDRIHRIGQDDKVTYIHLVCPGTVDEKIATALSNKKNIAETLLDIRDLV